MQTTAIFAVPGYTEANEGGQLWEREFERYYNTERHKSFVQVWGDSWKFAVWLNIWLGVCSFFTGPEITFRQFLVGLAVSFPVALVLHLALMRWLRRRFGPEDTGSRPVTPAAFVR